MENRIDYQGHAEQLKALAHPTRLQIVHGLLMRGCRNVRCIEGCTGVSQSAVSQHLQRLRSVDVVRAERSGNEVHYRVSSPKIARMVAALMEEEVDHYVL